MMKDNHPLVSVPVITYNSSATVLDTLTSIYQQTYKNLELIISDDGSKDNTVGICREWIEKHKDRFKRIEIITVPKNTGVTANYQRAFEKCKGEWIKEIDGDDMLLPDCIEEYVNYVTIHPETIYLFGKVEVFGANKEVVKGFEDVIFDYSFFYMSHDEQYRWLTIHSRQPIPSVSSFYNKEKVQELGIIYDERIPMLEDWPRWLQLMEKGVHLHFVDKVIARYRVSGEASICSGTIYSEAFQKSLALMYFYYQYKPAQKYMGKIKAWMQYVACKKTLSDKVIWKVLYAINHIIMIPIKALVRIKKRVKCQMKK